MMYQEMFEALWVFNETPQEPHSFCFVAECCQVPNVRTKCKRHQINMQVVNFFCICLCLIELLLSQLDYEPFVSVAGKLYRLETGHTLNFLPAWCHTYFGLF